MYVNAGFGSPEHFAAAQIINRHPAALLALQGSYARYLVGQLMLLENPGISAPGVVRSIGCPQTESRTVSLRIVGQHLAVATVLS